MKLHVKFSSETYRRAARCAANLKANGYTCSGCYCMSFCGMFQVTAEPVEDGYLVSLAKPPEGAK